MAEPARFHELPLEDFPLRIVMLDAETREERWTADVPGPGALRVPGRDTVNAGRPVIVRVTFADGRVSEAGQP